MQSCNDHELGSVMTTGGGGLPGGASAYAVASRSNVRQRVRDLAANKAEIVTHMLVLVKHYRAAYREPPVGVLVQRVRGGHIYVRWRMTCQGRRVLVNPQTTETQVWIEDLPNVFREQFLGYLRQSLDLNLVHSLFHVEWSRLRQYLDDRQALDALPSVASMRHA